MLYTSSLLQLRIKSACLGANAPFFLRHSSEGLVSEDPSIVDDDMHCSKGVHAALDDFLAVFNRSDDRRSLSPDCLTVNPTYYKTDLSARCLISSTTALAFFSEKSLTQTLAPSLAYIKL
jgi:hypothetical protein